MDTASLPSPPYDIAERTFLFACANVNLCRQLDRRGWIAQHIARQLLRSATSVAANVEEAQAPTSVRDFVSRGGVALREVRESRFWLRLALACDLAAGLPVGPLHDEACQLTAILTTMIRNSRARIAEAKAKQKHKKHQT